jgi:hypothetical protein
MKKKEYEVLVEAISTLPCCKSKDEIPCPLDDCPSIDGLPILSGYRCKLCRTFKTQSKAIISRHIFDQHSDSLSQNREQHYESVALQSWSSGWRGGYWTVADSISSIHSLSDIAMDPSSNTQLTWEERMMEMESKRLQDQDNRFLQLGTKNQRDDTSPWLMFTKWPTIFEGKDIKLIGETKDLNTTNRHVLEISLINITQLGVLSRAFDRIIEWALETLESTNWNLRCWLRSPSRSEPSHKQFSVPQSKVTVKRYCRYWKQFLYYCFRTGLLNGEYRKRLYGIQFSAEQSRLIQDIKGMF